MVITKSKCRSVISQQHKLSFRKVDPRKEPALFEQLDSMDIEKLLPEKIALLWKIMRVFNSSPQSIPHFVGWVIQAFGRLHSKMTMITFLPPILHPITQYNTSLNVQSNHRNLHLHQT